MPQVRIPLVVNLEIRLDPDSTNTSTDIEVTSGMVNSVVDIDTAEQMNFARRRAGVFMKRDINAAAGLGSIFPKGLKYDAQTDADEQILEGAVDDELVYNGTTIHVLSAVTPQDRWGATIHPATNDTYWVGSELAGFTGTPVMYESGQALAPTQFTNGANGIPNSKLVPSVVELDTYLFIMTYDGLIYNSNLNVPGTWTSTDFIGAEVGEGDFKVYLARHHDNIVAIGTRYMEFFYNAGNPAGSPLAPRTDVKIPMGVLAETGGDGSALSQAVHSDNETIAFIASKGIKGTRSGQPITSNHDGVYLVEGFQLKKISTPSIDKWISHSLSDTGNIPAVRIFQYQDRKMVMVRLHAQAAAGSVGGTLIYDTVADFWYLWNWASDGAFSVYETDGEWLAGNTTRIGRFDFTLTQDQTGTGPDTYFPFNWQITTPRWDGGTRDLKFCTETALVADHAQATNAIRLSWNDDNDYTTYSIDHDIDLEFLYTVDRCGSFNSRNWRLQQDFNDTGIGQPVRVSHLECEISSSGINKNKDS